MDKNYEDKLYADGFRKIEISVNGEKCTTIWGLRSDDPLKDEYLELRSNGEDERFEIVGSEYLPIYEPMHKENEDGYKEVTLKVRCSDVPEVNYDSEVDVDQEELPF